MIGFLLLWLPFNSISAEIIGAFVLPHGGIALDPTHFNTTNQTSKKEAWEIYLAARDVGRLITDLQPDVIFLSTPHGVSDLKKFAFFLNPNGYGEAETDNCQCPPCCYNVSVKFDTKITKQLVDNLDIQHQITGLTAYGEPYNSEEAFPLKWGEVIPLYFMRSSNSSKIVTLSIPSRRYNDATHMVPELLDLGSALYHQLNILSERIVIVISCDLAHTHDPNGPYGYSDAADPFDKACGSWASSLKPDELLSVATSYVDDAKSCGYTGLVLLNGLLDAGNLSSWQPHLYTNHHPSYYGMMVASFLKKHNDDVCS